jgi:TPR repeat protein
MYFNGQGAALNRYRNAADQGNASAQSALGSMYANGDGVSRDYAAVLKDYAAALLQGRDRAARNQILNRKPKGRPFRTALAPL